MAWASVSSTASMDSCSPVVVSVRFVIWDCRATIEQIVTISAGNTLSDNPSV